MTQPPLLQVRGVEWSPDDGRLVSCGLDGAVYEWDTHTGRRVSECVLKSCSYTDVVFSSDAKTILAVGTDRTLKEIQDCQVRDRNTGTQQDLRKRSRRERSLHLGPGFDLEGTPT